MASHPIDDGLDVQEQLARIRKMQAEMDRMFVENHKFVIESLSTTQEIKLATPQMFSQGALAMAALIGAGAALAKLFF